MGLKQVIPFKGENIGENVWEQGCEENIWNKRERKL
jgi:hypothetical protein